MRKLIPFLAVYVLTLVSCLKSDSLDASRDHSSADGMAVLAVFNGIKGAEQMDVSLDGERLNTGIEALRYGEILRHRTVYPGDRRVMMEIRFNNQKSTPLSTDLRLLPGKNYSLFLTGAEPLTYELLEDDLILPRDGQFKLRVANTSVSGKGVALGNSEERDKYFSTIQAGKMTAFSTFDLGDESWQLSTQEGSKSILPLNFKPVNRGVYTIWLTGSIAHDTAQRDSAVYTIIKHP